VRSREVVTRIQQRIDESRTFTRTDVTNPNPIVSEEGECGYGIKW